MVARLRELLNEFDANGDGVISVDEAKAAYEKLGKVWVD